MFKIPVLNVTLSELFKVIVSNFSLSMYNVTLPVGIVPFEYLGTSTMIVPFSP